ncbi:MAG TPA: GNAT family N-acetyltransferase, partial [Thermoplasmata archaeon]|nr:GNAT family N-acetyltransferase [Thermoplasmata archaeon]
PVIVRMLREMYGPVDTSWLEAFPGEAEQRCFVASVAGEIAGVGWVSVASGRGRLHSLSVRPRYRRMRIGTDLWHARRLWAEHVGAQQLISEISEQNVASLAIATAGGMHPMGQLLLCYRSESGGPGRSQVSGAPQLGQALSVTSIRVPQ